MTKVDMFTYKSASLILTVWEEGTYAATISDLYSKQQKKGHATKLLTKVTRLCDKLNLTIILEVISGDPESMSDAKLQEFYERFEFEVSNPGSHPVIMTRNPKK